MKRLNSLIDEKMRERITACGTMAVTAASPAAASIGLSMLLEGGNAFDAAVAACLAEGVALPMKCGLGGDLVALSWAENATPVTLISVGAGGAKIAPHRLPSLVGGASVGPPGAAPGYAALAARGRLGLPRLTAPAIALARRGTPWSPLAVALTTEAETLLRTQNAFPLPFFPDGRLPVPGETQRLHGLATLLEHFADAGAKLWDTEVGTVLMRRLEYAGALLDESDLRRLEAVWSAAEACPIGSESHLWTTPAPTHGPDLVAAVASVLQDGLDPVESVLRLRRAQSAPRHASEFTGTSVVTAADGSGQAVVIVHSNSFPQYGSGVVVPEYDLVLNNRAGRGFDLKAAPEAPNAPRPGAIPRVTLHAWALRVGEWRALGATPGGLNQLPWNLQTLLPLLHRDDPAQAVLRPRWQLHPRGGEALTYEAEHPDGGTDTVPYLSMRSASQILYRTQGAAFWHAVADPRTGATGVAA